MARYNIPILLGTGRSGRQSEKVAAYILVEAKKFGFNSRLLDVRDFGTPFTTPSWQPQAADKRWRQSMAKADGLIIVAPEYNHGYPGELKIVLDKLYDEYAHKPVAICGVSSGRLGGARMIQSLKPVLIELHMVVIGYHLVFGPVKELFSAKGSLNDPSYSERLQKMFNELAWYAERLR